MSQSSSLHFLIPALWLLWIVYWLAVAGNVKRTRWREPARAAAMHGALFFACILLLVAPGALPAALRAPLAFRGPAASLAGDLMVAAGLGFAVWARLHLGRNWSSRVELKEEHSLIRTGPYRLVRHPIYSGLILALAGTALAIGQWRGVLAVAFAVLGILQRVRGEEVQMRRAFPEYEQYRKQTAALIPFVV